MKKKFQEDNSALEQKITTYVSTLAQDVENFKYIVSPDGPLDQRTKQRIDSELDLFAADRIGMPDYALASQGARIVDSFSDKKNFEFNLPLEKLSFKEQIYTLLTSKPETLSGGPENILEPSLEPGNCWSFPGAHGNVVVRLRCPLQITNVSIDHAHEKVLPDRKSSPNQFKVWGIPHYQSGSVSQKNSFS